MGAYTALLSLSKTLDQIFLVNEYPHCFKKEVLVSLQGNVSTLLKFLEEYSHKHRGAVNPREKQIIDAAYEAEDIIDCQLASPQPSAFTNMLLSCLSFCCKEETESNEINMVLQHISSFLEEVANNQEETISLPEDFSDSASLSTVAPTDTNNTVGLDDDFIAVKGQMYQQSSTFRVIAIYGTGGIGKTTLARRLYEDSIKMQYFDRCIWVVVSQDYSLRNILLGILVSIKKLTEEKFTDAELVSIVHQELFGRRYIVVADDVWNEAAWDLLNRILPKDTKGSQVLVTTRLQKVAAYAGSSSCRPHEIRFLSDDHSWKLLEERVFGKESYSSQLESVGKEIARCCKRLPLMIVVVAGLLKDNTSEAYWRGSLSIISSSERTELVEHCSKVLSLSYDHLPMYLKPCFLYVAAFPEDYDVKINRLARLWMAEGFVKPRGLKCLEEVADEYLADLVDRSLLIASKKKYGKIRAFKFMIA